MMNNYFIAKVRYARETGEGKLRNVTEQYLVEAETFAEVEYRITEEIKPFVFNSDCTTIKIISIKREKFEQLIFDSHSLISEGSAMAIKVLGTNNSISSVPDKWFKCKVNYMSVDEECGKEKKISTFYYVHANSIDAAHKLLELHFKQSVVDITFANIVETPIMDVLLRAGTDVDERPINQVL